MSHVVEVRHIGVDHAAALDEFQRWLDRQGIQPTLFEHSAGGPGITFRVHFTMANEAVAFAESFHGWLNDGTEPEDGILWDATSCAKPSAVPTASLDLAIKS